MAAARDNSSDTRARFARCRVLTGIASSSIARQDVTEPRQPQIEHRLPNKYVAVRHREDKSFDPLGRSSSQTSYGVAEWAKAQITWPGQRSILYPVLKLCCFNVPVEYPDGPAVRILRGNGGL